jgi:glycine/D-amino acid oxidase-like deaminating enzyme
VTPAADRYRRLSLWHDTLGTDGADGTDGPDPLIPRPALDGDTDVDVCIVGAGLTGLWSAHSLLRADPGLRVLVVEAEIAGFGASGRNGGWCSALFPTSVTALARRHGREPALALRRAMNDTVTEVGRVVADERIACDWARAGTVLLARTPQQAVRARAVHAEDVAFDGVDGVQPLSADEARARVGATEVLGGTFHPHTARVHPARLVRGLARAVERRGGRIVEGTRVREIVPSRGPARGRASLPDPGDGPEVRTDRGTVRAGAVLRATEAWTATLPGSTRAIAPVYSLMIATEPLPDDFWRTAGLARGETFADHRHLVVYGQRSADGRLVFGGRGAPYHFGSRISPAFDRAPRVFTGLTATLHELFPGLAGYRISHLWGGPLGVPRDWHASVGFDPATGLGGAGGYVGDGVGSANLAGRTLADLVLGRDTELTRLPWVGHRSPVWEPEPLRWLGINAGLRAMSWADAEERVTGRASILARLFAPLLGH